jgi:hypothetical protein
LPLDTSLETLSYLVSHHILKKDNASKILHSARKFVFEKLSSWGKADYFEIPQYQIIENFNISE